MHEKIEQHLKKNNLLDFCYDNYSIFKKVYSDCLDISSEKILTLSDYGFDNHNLALALSHMNYLASSEEGIKNKIVTQDVRHRGDTADYNLIRALKELPDENIIFANVSERLGKLGQIGKSFRKFSHAHNHRFVSSTSLGWIGNSRISDFIKSFDVDYKALAKKHQKVKSKFDSASEINVTTKAGTDLTFNVEGMTSIAADGIYNKPGMGGNLPAGEVYIPPVDKGVFGNVVIDVSLKTVKETVLVKNPVELIVENGDISLIKGEKEAELLQQSLNWAFERAKNTWGIKRIGEFGIGLNDRAKPMGSTLIDEKVYGTAHVGIGSNYWFGGSVYALIHLDQVFKDPVVKVDGKKLNI